eukprot:GDKI01004943.1.p1 GENE.GDKI01004943.1~~GDKI01004943.1.p1  ORF type:complete len:246 (+),score=46.38 GDKI01004943.1:39-776(+)
MSDCDEKPATATLLSAPKKCVVKEQVTQEGLRSRSGRSSGTTTDTYILVPVPAANSPLTSDQKFLLIDPTSQCVEVSSADEKFRVVQEQVNELNKMMVETKQQLGELLQKNQEQDKINKKLKAHIEKTSNSNTIADFLSDVYNIVYSKFQETNETFGERSYGFFLSEKASPTAHENFHECARTHLGITRDEWDSVRKLKTGRNASAHSNRGNRTAYTKAIAQEWVLPHDRIILKKILEKLPVCES